MNLPLQYGSQGPDVKELQTMLNAVGNNLLTDGVFGHGTEGAVKKFQNSKGIIADGVVGTSTYNALRLAAFETQVPAPNSAVHKIIQLNDDEYIKTPSVKRGICFHHTVSDGNPASVVNNWENDGRGPVGTHFVIGREMVDGGKQYDGQVVQCFDLKYWAHHILTSRMGFNGSHNNILNSAYVGIELCSWGCLKKVGDAFYDLSGKIRIPEYQVCKLERPFRTYQYWHAFTDDQIHSLYLLCKHIAKECNIDLTDLRFEPENVDNQWWEMDWLAMCAGYGFIDVRQLTTHTNFEYGKFDTFPQPKLKEMIKMLYNGK